jgi:hypothetical protein
MNIARLVPLLFIFISSAAMAAGSYEFCVDRASPSKLERLHVIFKFGDIDPGKEAARLIISERYKQPDTTAVGVTDYSAGSCSTNPVEEVTVTASAEQLQNLANAVGSGNVPGAVIVAAAIAAGVTVSVVKEVGNAGGGIIEGAKKIICGILRC